MWECTVGSDVATASHKSYIISHIKFYLVGMQELLFYKSPLWHFAGRSPYRLENLEPGEHRIKIAPVCVSPSQRPYRTTTKFTIQWARVYLHTCPRVLALLLLKKKNDAGTNNYCEILLHHFQSFQEFFTKRIKLKFDNGSTTHTYSIISSQGSPQKIWEAAKIAPKFRSISWNLYCLVLVSWL